MTYFHLGALVDEHGTPLGAHRQADRATHEPSQSTLSPPCGECPLRGALDKIGDHLLAIGFEEQERRLNDAYDIYFQTLRPDA